MLPRPILHTPERPAEGQRTLTPRASVLGARPALPVDRTDIHHAGCALRERVSTGEIEVCTLLLRLDGLADLRERHGEDAATYVCTELIRRLLRCTRPQDVAGRCGSEDAIVLLLPCAPADAEALGPQLAARARAELSRPVQYRTLSLRLSCSVGRARWQAQLGTVDAAIEQARHALRTADQPRMPALPAAFAIADTEAADASPPATSPDAAAGT